MIDKRIRELKALAISESAVSIDGCYTNPRTYGVYEILAPTGYSRRFRFGNHPVRKAELTREYGDVKLENLFEDREHATKLANLLNHLH
jgi:hypothetical protein